MALQVHDSIVLQGPTESWREQAEPSKAIMEQRWEVLDGFVFKASVEYSPTDWASCKKVKLN